MFLGRGRGPFLNPVANCGIVQSARPVCRLDVVAALDRPGKLLLLALVPLFAWGIY